MALIPGRKYGFVTPLRAPSSLAECSPVGLASSSGTAWPSTVASRQAAQSVERCHPKGCVVSIAEAAFPHQSRCWQLQGLQASCSAWHMELAARSRLGYSRAVFWLGLVSRASLAGGVVVEGSPVALSELGALDTLNEWVASQLSFRVACRN